MAETGYTRVQKDLRKLIIKGDYNIGTLLPSENELSLEYGFSRMTIRVALKNLENEGLIYRKKGKGSFVAFKRKSIELLSVKGFTEVMKGKEDNISTIFIQKPKLKSWDQNFYWKLSKEEYNAGSIHFSRVRTIGSKSIMFENTFITNKKLENFCKTPFINDSLFDTLLINYDIEITSVTQKFRAIFASESLAKKLHLKKGDPVLEIIRKLSTSKFGLYLYSFIYCNTADFSIET